MHKNSIFMSVKKESVLCELDIFCITLGKFVNY